MSLSSYEICDNTYAGYRIFSNFFAKHGLDLNNYVMSINSSYHHYNDTLGINMFMYNDACVTIKIIKYSENIDHGTLFSAALNNMCLEAMYKVLLKNVHG